MAAAANDPGWRGIYTFDVKTEYHSAPYNAARAATLWHIIKNSKKLTVSEVIARL